MELPWNRHGSLHESTVLPSSPQKHHGSMEIPMRTPWAHHESPHGAPWKPYGSTMESLCFHASTMYILRKHHGFHDLHENMTEAPRKHCPAVDVCASSPRKHHGSMEIPMEAPWAHLGRPHGAPWNPYGGTMEALCFHASIMYILWKHHGFLNLHQNMTEAPRKHCPPVDVCASMNVSMGAYMRRLWDFETSMEAQYFHGA